MERFSYEINGYNRCEVNKFVDNVIAQTEEFETKYVSQGNSTDRTIEDTLRIGWELLTILPRAEMKRIRDKYLEEYYDKMKVED